MANEFKVKNGIKFPDNTIQTSAASSAASSTLTISDKTAAYTVVAGDLGTIINCTANTFTVSLTAAATLGAGFNVTIWNTGSGNITIDPAGSETIDGKTTRVLRTQQGTQIVCNGTNFNSGAPKQYNLYDEKYDPTIGGRPAATATQGSVAIGYDAIAGGNVAVAAGFVASSGGEGSLALGYRATASSGLSTAIGQNSSYQGSQAVTGLGAMALGGSYASGTDSFAAAVVNNTSSYGATGISAIAVGWQVKATGHYSIALSRMSTASGADSFARGLDCLASGEFSEATGQGSIAAQYGKRSYASGYFSFRDAQHGQFVLRRSTTTATPGVLTTNDITASTTNQVILPNDSTYIFRGQLVARNTGNDADSKAWEFKGAIRRGTSAATTALIGTPSIDLIASDGSAWTVALTADTTNGGLAITVTGEASKTIRWVATVITTEVTG